MIHMTFLFQKKTCFVMKTKRMFSQNTSELYIVFVLILDAFVRKKNIYNVDTFKTKRISILHTFLRVRAIITYLTRCSFFLLEQFKNDMFLIIINEY